MGARGGFFPPIREWGSYRPEPCPCRAMSVCKGRQGPLCPLAQCVQLSNCQRWSGRVTTWGLWTATHSYLIKPAAQSPFIFAMDDDDEDDSSGRERGSEHGRARLFFLPKALAYSTNSRERLLCSWMGNTGWQSPRLMLLLSSGQKNLLLLSVTEIGQWCPR